MKTRLRKPEARLGKKIKFRHLKIKFRHLWFSPGGNSDAGDHRVEPGTSEAFYKGNTC